jgi:S-adenosyl-L-methionine hydrolase (adenosine-forming)
MKITLIADIHANLPALESVLRHARAHQADDVILNLGDSVGYGAFPDEVVQRIQALRFVNIRGNYDKKVLSKKKRKKGWKSINNPDKRVSFAWAYENLSKQSRKFLKPLPKKRTVKYEGVRILMVHGSPDSHTEHLLPDTPQWRLDELAEMVSADVVLCGHSHEAFSRKARGVLFINPGSVGRPDDGDPRASYAILEVQDGQVAVRHHRVAYDLVRAAGEIRRQGLPEIFAQIIYQGYDHKDVTRMFNNGIPQIPHLEPNGALTLLTDFGLKDYFVGVMKGVIDEIAPHSRVIDISHQVRPQNIREGARMLAESVPYFLPGSVHVAVVDPGVGTGRRALAAQIGRHFYVAPDNGLLTPLILKARKTGQPIRLVSLTQPQYWLDQVSQSFHGRDIFAPVGAHLVNGLPLEKLGEVIMDPVLLKWPQPKQTAKGWRAEVVMVDVFGNLSTNLSADKLPEGYHDLTIKIKGKKIATLTRAFGDAPDGRLIATVDSSGSLAISVVNGSAAKMLEADLGTRVDVIVD